MKMSNVEVVISGIKRFKGEVDGQKYDTTTVFVDTDLTEGENARGRASVAYKLGDSQIYQSLLPYTLPLQAKVDITVTTNGSKTQHTMKLKEVMNQQRPKAA